VAYADALPTVASVTGQWLLARKYVQTWPTWLVVNVYSVGLFAHKALWVTAALYAVFAVLSVAGWRAWRRLEREAA
jgi:nicotinamide mononucleotide transporter